MPAGVKKTPAGFYCLGSHDDCKKLLLYVAAIRKGVYKQQFKNEQKVLHLLTGNGQEMQIKEIVGWFKILTSNESVSFFECPKPCSWERSCELKFFMNFILCVKYGIGCCRKIFLWYNKRTGKMEVFLKNNVYRL